MIKNLSLGNSNKLQPHFWRAYLFPLIFTSLLAFFSIQKAITQTIVINEVVSSNSMYLDEEGDSKDWIELYNPSNEDIALHHWSLTDNALKSQQWVFPDVVLPAQSFMTVFASDKNRKTIAFQEIINKADSCKYILPNQTDSINWRTEQYSDEAWKWINNDFTYRDIYYTSTNKIFPNSIFIRYNFTLENLEHITEILVQLNFSDGFVAYLNGKEIGRNNISKKEILPSFKTKATLKKNSNSVLSKKEAFQIKVRDLKPYKLKEKNILAIQVHNFTTSKALDLSLNTSLSVGLDQINQGPPISTDALLEENRLHTNFKLSNGETLYLLDSNKKVQDSITIPSLRSDLSFGRFPDGNNQFKFFHKNTPNYTNSSINYNGIIDSKIHFSTTGGWSISPLKIKLSSTSGQEIRYTLNGATPNKQSDLYKKPLKINANTVIRAVLFKEGYLPSKIFTEHYLFEPKPNLPVIALAIDPEFLFNDSTGMYMLGMASQEKFPYYGANYWEDKELPVHLAFFDTDNKHFVIDAGVKIFGGGSRTFPQRSLSIFARYKYGYKSLKYKLFQERDYTSYEAFILRNSGSDWQKSMLKDMVLSSTLEGLEVDYQKGRSVIAFLNGEYWGIYNMREKINEHYLSSLHNTSTKELTILEGNAKEIYGSKEEYEALSNFVSKNNLSNEDNYQIVKQQVDITNLLQYNMAQIYFANTDWPGKNTKYWKSKGGKWRWILFDTDAGFNLDFVEHNTLNFARRKRARNTYYNSEWASLYFNKLIENKNFKQDFINNFADVLNTRFAPENIKAHINTYAQALESELPRHFDKWNAIIKSNYSEHILFNERIQSMDKWKTTIQNMKVFAEKRPAIIRKDLVLQFNLIQERKIKLSNSNKDGGFILLNTLQVRDSEWDGIYFEGNPIKIKAIPVDGFEFVNWSRDITSNTQELSITLDKDYHIQVNFKKKVSK